MKTKAVEGFIYPPFTACFAKYRPTHRIDVSAFHLGLVRLSLALMASVAREELLSD